MMTRKLTIYKAFEAQLKEFEIEYGSLILDCSDKAGMTAAKASRKEIRDTRSNLEDLRKETKAPALAKCVQIDAEAKAIKEKLDTLFNKFDTAIKDVEQAAQRAKEAKLKEAEDKLRALEAREEAIRLKEIELGLREPDEEEEIAKPVTERSVNPTVRNGTPRADVDMGSEPPAVAVVDASVICEPHIKAAAERLGVIKKIRSIIEPTDAQPKGKMDKDIAKIHDAVLAEVWDLVDCYK